MEQTFMKEKKILPLVLSMSLPMMLSMLVNSLYNIVDSYFVAQISEQAMTALSSISTPITGNGNSGWLRDRNECGCCVLSGGEGATEGG